MIAFAAPKDLARIQEIWHACFDDSVHFVDTYYRCRPADIQTLVYREEDGVISSMLEMVPCSLHAAGVQAKAFYIYAAATHPVYQGKRRMHRLIEAACALGKERGMAASMLIPQNEGLVGFYKQQQYQVEIAMGQTILGLTSSRVTVEPMCCQEFIQQKQAYEAQFPCYVAHDTQLCGFVYRLALAAQGAVMRLQSERENGYAICYTDGRVLLVQETSCQGRFLQESASALCSLFGCDYAKVNRPGGGRLYGLARILDPSYPIDWENLYMNTMLD